MAEGSRRRRPRGPGLLYSVVASAAVLTLGIVALNAQQAPPPTVAEFAPAALDQIKDAPDRQSSDFGKGAGGGTGTSTPTTPPPSASPSPSGSPPPVSANVRHCVGDPPRQIEDPQSPPCVPYFQGDNGGATSFGVTADEIRVAVPYGTAFTNFGAADFEALAKFFNNRFEFYGRQLRLIPYITRGDNFAVPNPPDMIADATQVHDEYKAFASLGYTDRKGAEHTYYDELARRHVIAVMGRDTALGTEARLAQHAPYEWSRGTTIDRQLANYGQFVCGSLVGKAPAYGGPFVPAPATRKFGVLRTRDPDGTVPDVRPLTDALAACGVHPVVVEAPYASDPRDGLNPIVSLSNDHVTSVICVCEVGSLRSSYMPAASGQGYDPEWLLGSYLNNDLDNSFVSAPPDQTQHVIGVTFNNKVLRDADLPWYWAYREGDPSRTPPPTGSGLAMTSVYEQMLLLASGIQMAGPDLTPQTFQAALQRTVFPNPGAGSAPYYQARVGFPGGTHSMKQDAAMYWFDQARQGTNDPSNPGAICYVVHGRRYGLGAWPRGSPPFKQGSCA